jgi:hypothetical protein
LGGLVLFVTTLYCGPRKRTGKGRGEEGAGIYPELCLTGFTEGVSPGLASEIARQSALLPSFEMARKEFGLRGNELDIKYVYRVSLQVGKEILTVRKQDMNLWRNGQMAKGSEFAGKRVGIATDGGRVRLRERVRRQRGKGKKKVRRRGWKAEWREPKKFVIFELDENGRMKHGTRPFIDGTLQGPDALMELLAMRLYQLGVTDAEEIVVLGDGGTWIWNRLDSAGRLAEISPEKVYKVLDFYHATHHIHLVLSCFPMDAEKHGVEFKRMRKMLYKGQVRKIIEELENREKDAKDKKGIEREIKYFKKHEEHMAYKELRAHGRPMGSGAIESVIRRVLNQRIKGNGIMWLKGNAEALMVMRGSVLAGRWEETLAHVRAKMIANRKIDWTWSSPDMRTVLEPDEEDPASKLEPHVIKGFTKKRRLRA